MIGVDERAALVEQMRRTHKMRVLLTLRDLDDKVLSNISARLLDGQVNIDTSAETDRQLSLTFDDPSHSLALDSDSPSDGALYLDRMIGVEYGVYVEALARWVDVPLFVGPIVTMQRSAGQVSVSCLGKEHLASSACWRPLTLKKGMSVVDAIRTILRERAGESRFAFPSTKSVKARLPRTMSLGRTSIPWVEARKLADAIGRQLYYDGEGVCRLRRAPGTSLFTFDEHVVISDPSIEYDLSSIVNTVWVKGHKPKGKDRVTATAVAPRSHALSPWRLGRNDAPRYIVELVEKDGVRSQRDARELAQRQLDTKLREGVSASFETLPVVHLDPLDVVQLKTSDASITFALRTASIPLTHSGSMSVGAVKRVAPRRERIR